MEQIKRVRMAEVLTQTSSSSNEVDKKAGEVEETQNDVGNGSQAKIVEKNIVGGDVSSSSGPKSSSTGTKSSTIDSSLIPTIVTLEVYFIFKMVFF
jgi:hypothetical protein